MIYKHMYVGYVNNNEIIFKDDERLITYSVAVFEDMTFVYYETKDETLTINDVVLGNMKPFPNDDEWFEMNEIFHYFTPQNDNQWERKISKIPIFEINKLEKNMISSYIYHHVQHQNSNQFGFDKFFSIFIYGDTIVIYREDPQESITWAEIEGKQHIPQDQGEWNQLMDKHFKAWPDGEKKWVPINVLKWMFC